MVDTEVLCHGAEGVAADSGAHVPLQGCQDQGRHPAAGMQGSGPAHTGLVAICCGTHRTLVKDTTLDTSSVLEGFVKWHWHKVSEYRQLMMEADILLLAIMQASAKFSPLQRQQLIALRAKFLRDIDEVVAERRVLTQAIKVAASILFEHGTYILFSSGGSCFMGSSVNVLHCVEHDLAATLRRDLLPAFAASYWFVPCYA